MKAGYGCGVAIERHTSRTRLVLNEVVLVLVICILETLLSSWSTSTGETPQYDPVLKLAGSMIGLSDIRLFGGELVEHIGGDSTHHRISAG